MQSIDVLMWSPASEEMPRAAKAPAASLPLPLESLRSGLVAGSSTSASSWSARYWGRVH